MKFTLTTTKLGKVLILATIIFLVSFKHPFYLGVTDLKYNSKEKVLQGSIKLFTNDLEAALKKMHNTTIDLINVKNEETTSVILYDYLKKHFSIKVNDKINTYKLIGFEREEEALWMHVEFEKTEIPKKIDVENTLLYDYLKEQMNIVHIEIEGIKMSSRVTNPNKSLHFDF